MSVRANATLYAPSVALIMCLTGLPQLSETIYTPALPDIARALMTSQHWVQWTLSIYFWGFALGVFFWGRYSDHIGRRAAMHRGYAVYIIASLVCALVTNIDLLLAARFLQAFGASVGSVITQAVLRDRFSGKERHQLFSIVGYALALAPVVGPLLGGFIVQWFSWEANLILLVMMGMGVLSYSWLKLPETHPPETRNQRKEHLSRVLKWLVTDKYVLASAYLVGAFNGLLFSYYAEAPFVFINILHLSPSQYGMLGFVIAAGYMLGSWLSHQLNEHYSPGTLISLGCMLSIIGSSALFVIAWNGFITPAHTLISVSLVLASMFFVFVAFSLSIPNILSTALVNYTHVTGTASSIFGLMYYILIGVFTLIMGSFHAEDVMAMPIFFMILTLSMTPVHWLRQTNWAKSGQLSTN